MKFYYLSYSALSKRKPYYEYKYTHLFNNITTIELFMCFMAINTLKQFELDLHFKRF